MIVFICGARDFHAMDWYKSAKEIVKNEEVVILTDLIEGEGFKRLINQNDIVHNLIILDKLLFKEQSKVAHLWRNILKFLVLPLQVYKVKKFSKNNPNAKYHAHSMYYIWLAWLAGIKFVGTPQGSDILIKPNKSKIFKFLSKKAMRFAKGITVDSEAMKIGVKKIANVNANIIQNGIDLLEIRNINTNNYRNIILSIRGFTPLYRINEIVLARNRTNFEQGIKFIYPFSDIQYKSHLKLVKNDEDIGRVDRNEMYQLLAKTLLVISIPISDSSPRSVYESVFCGAAVAITYNKYYDALPNCMKKRIIIIDLNEKEWFAKTVELAKKIIQIEYVPSDEALNIFDQRRSFKKILELL